MLHNVHDWLYTASWFGIQRGAWAAMTALTVLEAILGRSKNPRVRSVAAVIALGLHKLLLVTRIGLIPVVGPIVTSVLEAITGPPAAPVPIRVPSVSDPDPEPPVAA